MATVISDVLLLAPNALIRPVCIEIDDDGTISQVFEGHDPPAGSQVIFDGAGEIYVAAGFIDIHTHGANGKDLADATPEAVATIAEAKLAEGVTTFLPTTWTASRAHTQEMARAVATYREHQPFARTPFLHVEGPYLNPVQAGAQDAQYMRDPDLEEIEALDQICPVGLLSLAIEREGADALIQALSRRGIVTSAAHSAANYSDFVTGKQAGLKHLTHFCNQMSGLHHREIGLVGAGLLDDDIMIELICDGVHLSPEMIRLIFKQVPLERLMLITDSIAASHLGDGTYPIEDREIIVKQGAARIADGSLAGSVITFDRALKMVADLTEISLNELIRTTGTNQAKSLGLRDRGAIKQGLLADLTLLSPTLEIVATYVGGEPRFTA